MAQEKQSDIQLIIVIISSITTPLLIAILGWYIQFSISQRSLEKDYMAIAVSILNSPDTNNSKNENLKAWAVNIIEKNSPVSLSDSVKAELKNSQSLSFSTSLTSPPADLAQPCPNIPSLTGKTGEEILPYILELHSQYKDCAARQAGLVRAWPK